MIDPLFASLAGGLLASALSGVVGGRADSLVTTSYKKFIGLVKKGKNPQNHDLQKAIKRSYLQALLSICDDCLEKLKVNKKENSNAIEWLEEKIKNLKIEFENIEKQKYYDVPIGQLSEIELLVTPEGTLARDRIKVVRLELVRSALEDSGIPNCFREKVRDGLFEYVCNYFASELKDNPRVQMIFNSQLLAKISEESQGIMITLEKIVTSLQEISEKKYKLEKPIFTIEEYSRLSYIHPLLQYEAFIGRGEELRNLHRFLESDTKIMVMSGEGGVGKTKLSLEFANQVKEKGEWNTYYINPDIIEVGDLPRHEKILLILDDASNTAQRDSLIASVSASFSDDEMDLKLLLINRPIYNEGIKSFITQRNIPSTFLPVEKGDIIGFLKEYYDWVDDENAKKIEENCLNSFDFAIFFAEYYREKGEIGKAYDVIKWKAERYIKDIANMSSLSVVETRETIQLMSLLTPIYFDDIEHVRKLLILKNKDSFENVLRMASINKTGILFSDSDDKYLIKPDPLADFLRLELLNKDNFEKIWRHLFPYMAFRISQNIFVLPRYGGKNIEKFAKTLSQMWDELNRKCGKTPEYFSAIIFFTGYLYRTSLVGVNKININQWVRCYKEISEYYPDNKAVIENLATGLFNATSHYGFADNWKGMEECIKELRGLYEKNPDNKGVIENLASGLFNATNHYGLADNWKGMEECIKKLRGLYEKNPDDKDKAVIENLARGLVNATNHYGRMDNWKGVEECIKELRKLYEKNHDNKAVRENLASGLGMGLVNATSHYERTDNWKGMEECIKELRGLYEKNPDDKAMIENLGMGLVNATSHCGRTDNWKGMEECIKELRGLYEKNPDDKAVREKLAIGLFNVTNNYGVSDNWKGMEECIKELKGLYEKNPDDKAVREKLAIGLFNATNNYGVADNWKGVEECIKELRELYEKNPDDKAVIENLASSLLNAINHPIKQSYENFILLYKLRFDLREKENKENIHFIEITFIEETRDEIQSKYNKNNKTITDFVKNLHLVLNNETELVILIDRVAENLPIKTQNSLYEALTELGL